MNLRDRINQKATENSFSHHPLGKFGARVEDVLEKEHDGQTIYEIQLLSSIDRKAKVAIWRSTLANEIERAKATGRPAEEGEERFIGNMSRLRRLYTDLGVDIQEPGSDDADEIANAYYSGLGDIIGKTCSIAVVENKSRPDRGPNVYINAPIDGDAKKPLLRPNGSRTAPASSDLAGSDMPDLNDIPF